MKTALILLGTFIGVLAIIYFTASGEGIVALEGYSHGVAFCGKEYNYILHESDAHFWEAENISYVVNKGHYDDPQVDELVELATSHCEKYFND